MKYLKYGHNSATHVLTDFSLCYTENIRYFLKNHGDDPRLGNRRRLVPLDGLLERLIRSLMRNREN